MSFVSISDVHIKDIGDENWLILESFLDHPLTKQAKTIYFLGDIFDLLVGSYEEYYQTYKKFFEKVGALQRENKRVVFVEGNHDFHFEKLVSTYLPGSLYYESKFIDIHFGKNIMFCHGDDIEIGNKGYKRYKRFVTSNFARLLIDNILNFNILDTQGKNASKKSRKRNKQRYTQPDNQEWLKKRFREAAKIQFDKFGPDIIICGHSHIEDNTYIDGKLFINNGYVPISKKFIYGSEEGVKLISCVLD